MLKKDNVPISGYLIIIYDAQGNFVSLVRNKDEKPFPSWSDAFSCGRDLQDKLKLRTWQIVKVEQTVRITY